MVRRHKPWVQMTLPVLLAAVLIVLTMPVTCVMASPMPAGCDTMPVKTAAPSQTMPGGTAMPAGHTMPVKPAPRPLTPSGLCAHVSSATKALTPENLNLFAAFTAFIAIVLFAAPAMPRVVRIVLEPSPPPGLVLAATTVIRV